MLKKSDLAKQFELVVKQEIKNYQDSLNFVLQSIRELKDSIEEVRNESLENYALIHSQQNDLEILCQLFRENQGKTEKKLQSHINDTEAFKKKATDEIGMHGDTSMQNSRKNEYNENQISHTNGRLETVEDEMRGHSLFISTALENMKFKLSKDMNKLKEEILSMPSDAQGIRQELIDKINTHNVDVEGILREIRVSRHDMMVFEKKLENIYMLIERLSKPEVKP